MYYFGYNLTHGVLSYTNIFFVITFFCFSCCFGVLLLNDLCTSVKTFDIFHSFNIITIYVKFERERERVLWFFYICFLPFVCWSVFVWLFDCLFSKTKTLWCRNNHWIKTLQPPTKQFNPYCCYCPCRVAAAVVVFVCITLSINSYSK